MKVKGERREERLDKQGRTHLGKDQTDSVQVSWTAAVPVAILRNVCQNGLYRLRSAAAMSPRTRNSKQGSTGGIRIRESKNATMKARRSNFSCYLREGFGGQTKWKTPLFVDGKRGGCLGWNRVLTYGITNTAGVTLPSTVLRCWERNPVCTCHIPC